MLRDADERTMTFGEFRRAAEETAAGLHGLGVTEGTPVSWQIPTSISTIVLTAALARLGAKQNPILHIYRERELEAAFRGTRPKLVVITPEWRGVDYAVMTERVLDSLGNACRHGDTSTDDGAPSITEERPVVIDIANVAKGDVAALPPPPGNGDEIRWIYYTSGTTSEPKGVMHTDGTLLAGGYGLAEALGVGAHDVGSIAFPFAHIAGPDYLVTMLISGFQAVVLDAFVPAEAVKIYRRAGVTIAGGSTAFYQAFLAEQRKQPGSKAIPTLRILSGGGASKPAELFHTVLEEMGVRIIHGYGMTEIPMITMGSPLDDDEQLIVTEGAPVAGAEVRIVGDEEAELPLGHPGEVRVRGPMVCKGYTDAVSTRAAFDAEGWFRTGDVGYLRPDGHVVLTGRLKDIIIRKGENISAREVEELVYGHPKVGEVAVIGIPDSERGELVCAVVEPAQAAEEPLTLEELAEWLTAKGVMRQKIPEQLELVERLPRNETLQKVQKFKLRERFAATRA